MSPEAGKPVPRRRAVILALAGFLVLLSSGLYLLRDELQTGRDIGCHDTEPGRARQICRAIAASMEWEWFGHAIVSPGYKSGFRGIRRVFCELEIGRDDAEILRRLAAGDSPPEDPSDWRLASAANSLQ